MSSNLDQCLLSYSSVSDFGALPVFCSISLEVSEVLKLTRGYHALSQTNPIENNCSMRRGTKFIMIQASVANVMISFLRPL